MGDCSYDQSIVSSDQQISRIELYKYEFKILEKNFYPCTHSVEKKIQHYFIDVKVVVTKINSLATQIQNLCYIQDGVDVENGLILLL